MTSSTLAPLRFHHVHLLSGPQSALWHFGWHVTDSRANTHHFFERDEVKSLPLYTGVGNAHVPLSSDTWFMNGDKIGVTLEQIDTLKADGQAIHIDKDETG